VSASGNGDVAAKLRQTEEALAEALEERARLWDEANRRRAAEQELAEVRKMVDQMQSSPSWKLTAPLRLVKKGWVQREKLAKRGVAALRKR
jgi:hypothetical protein